MTTELQDKLNRVADAACGCSTGSSGYNQVLTENLDARMNEILALLPPEARRRFDDPLERNLDTSVGNEGLTRGESRSVIIAAALELRRAGLLDDDTRNDNPTAITAQSIEGVAREQLERIQSAVPRR